MYKVQVLVVMGFQRVRGVQSLCRVMIMSFPKSAVVVFEYERVTNNYCLSIVSCQILFYSAFRYIIVSIVLRPSNALLFRKTDYA